MSHDMGSMMAAPGEHAGMSRSWHNEQPVGLAGIGLLMQQVPPQSFHSRCC